MAAGRPAASLARVLGEVEKKEVNLFGRAGLWRRTGFSLGESSEEAVGALFAKGITVRAGIAALAKLSNRGGGDDC